MDDSKTAEPIEPEPPAGPANEMSIRIEDDTACLSCGYALKGLRLADSCPECGLAVSTTMERMHGLTSRQFFTLGIRLFALFVLAWPFASSYGVINEVMWYLLNDQTNYYYQTNWLNVLMPAITAVVCATLLWFAAPLVACIAAPKSFPLIANIGGPRTALMIGLSIFAMWLLARGADGLVRAIADFVLGGGDEASDQANIMIGFIASGILNSIAGVLMLVWLVRHRDRLR
ncbi:MAG: hypothetical protein AAF085_10990 [Planctomycetota bacterium]